MGKLIVIDGLDGSGKHTQIELLNQFLLSRGKDVTEISFPVYDSEGCIFVKKYLDGEFGKNAGDTSAYAASLFFGLDRFYSYRTTWKKDLDREDSVVIADRYTTANAVHQLSKLPQDEWDSFLDWLWDTEFTKLGLPKPDLVIYLEVRPDIAIDNINKRSIADHRKKDIHEADPFFLYKSYDAALYASRKLGWKTICCYRDNALLSREEIARAVEKEVSALLEIQ